MTAGFLLHVCCFKFKRNQESHGFVYWKFASISWYDESFWLKPELNCFPWLSCLPGNHACLGQPGEVEARSGLWWQIILNFSIPVMFCEFYIAFASCSLVSVPPTTFKFFFFLVGFFFFSFIFYQLVIGWHTLSKLSLRQRFTDKNNTFTSQGTKWEKNEEQY